MHDVPAVLFVTFMLAMLAMVIFAFRDGYSRAKRLHARIDEEIAKRYKTEDEYHELMLHTISCRRLMWKSGVEPPELPPHLSNKNEAKSTPRGPVN